MTAIDTRLTVLTNQAAALIRDEVRAMNSRRQLESAVRQVAKQGVTVNEISASTGLTPSDIYSILDTPEPLEDIAALAGTAA